MSTTKIEWATHTWNPFTGCDRVSAGCANCYAIPTAAANQRKERGRAAKALADGKPEPAMRYQTDGDPRTSGPGFGFAVHWDKLRKPERFPAGARVFVNSMSDVFHEDVPAEALRLLWLAFAARPDVVWIVLTKRADRMRSWVQWIESTMPEGTEWPLPNVWLGVSVENRSAVHRADELRRTPAAVRVVSAEPLLGPLVGNPPVHPKTWERRMEAAALDAWMPGPDENIAEWQDRTARAMANLDLTGVDWLIVGGESGKGHRELNAEWMRDLRDACMAQDWRCECGDLNRCHEAFCYRCGAGQPEEGARTALFVKQMGGARPGDRLEDLPEDLRLRELPAPAVRPLTA